jgi:hypothetical protein
MTLPSSAKKDPLLDIVVSPLTAEQQQRLNVLDRFIQEFCDNEEEEKNVFFLMKLNRLLGDSPSLEFSVAMADVVGKYPVIIAKLIDMAYEGYGLALQTFLFLVDSEACVKLMSLFNHILFIFRTILLSRRNSGESAHLFLTGVDHEIRPSVYSNTIASDSYRD